MSRTLAMISEDLIVGTVDESLSSQGTFLPESLDDYVSDTNLVRGVDVFVDELDLVNLVLKAPFQLTPAFTIRRSS